jgi:hypothetical protein
VTDAEGCLPDHMDREEAPHASPDTQGEVKMARGDGPRSYRKMRKDHRQQRLEKLRLAAKLGRARKLAKRRAKAKANTP